MPVTLTDRLPVPSLRTYTGASVLLLALSVYYAIYETSDPGWKLSIAAGGNKIAKAGELPSFSEAALETDYPTNDTRTFSRQMADAATFMVQEPTCIWTLINIAYCCLFVVGRSIQRVVFGELRVSERQHVKDKFWNFVFYKFIFVFGVINVQYMDEVVLWCAWFTALGFLHLLAQLCKDRFEYLSFSSTSGGWAGARLAALLGGVLGLAALLLLLCGAVAICGGGINTFFFMAAEVILLFIRTLHVIFKYTLHVVEARASGGNALEPNAEDIASPSSPGEGSPGEGSPGEGSPGPAQASSARDRRAPLAHYAELTFELAALFADLLHHLHMLLWSNIFLSMASLVICMQLRYLFHEIQRRIKRHHHYLCVLKHMERHYPMATSAELTENSDNCAICWEKMESARKLPCNHLFHNSCLSSWLQQDTSCPTCRMVLSLWPPTPPAANAHQASRTPNHFFHFDGSRYVSWLPSFSVEVTHMMRGEPHATNSQMDAMGRQVQQLFPHYPITIIMQDLVITRSVELTVENILDNRLVLPARLLGRDASPPTPSAQASTQLLQHSLAMLATQFHRQAADAAPSHVESDDSEPTAAGGRFSKCSHERERILQRRKEQLVNSARKKYLDRQTDKNEETQSSSEEAASTSHSAAEDVPETPEKLTIEQINI